MYFDGNIHSPSAGNSMNVRLWQEHAASPLFVTHLGFGIGSFLAPQIANPFLAVIETVTRNTTAVSTTGLANVTISLSPTFESLVETVNHVSNSTNETSTVTSVVKESRIEYAYLIIGIVTSVISALLFFVVFKYRGNMQTLQIKEDSEREKDQTLENNRANGIKDDEKSDTVCHKSRFRALVHMINPATCAGGDLWFGFCMFFLISFIIFIDTGHVRVVGKFLFSYARDQFKFHKDKATLLNSSYWISYSVGRVFGFIVAIWIPIKIIVAFSTLGLVGSSIALSIAGHTDPTILWVFMQGMAFFITQIYVGIIGLGNKYVEMKGLAFTFIVAGGGLGGTIFMLFFGTLYDNYGPTSFLYVMLASSVVVIMVLTVVMIVLGVRHGERFENEEDDSGHSKATLMSPVIDRGEKADTKL